VAKTRKPKPISVGGTCVTPTTARERKQINKSIAKTREKLRKRYPEIHGKTVDYVTHTVRDTMVHFAIQFTDRTMFSLRYACDMFVVGAELDDVRTGDCEPIREYMKPIPR
jgi:hypothetical protein